MTQNAIEVHNLSKMFHIGTLMDANGQTPFSHKLARFATTPLRRAWSVLRNQLPESADATLWALRDVSFEVAQGEVLGIIGRNGAGKSTLLKILTGISKPTSGRALIRGRVGSLLEVGTGFHPELTGRENVFMNGSILGMRNHEIKARFDEIVAFSGVEQFIDTPVKRYSSGMQVRLAFSVAAHLDPEVLLVDEVLSVGDAEFRRKCMSKMRDVTGQGRTVLIVSHNMAAVQHLSDRVMVLESGQVQMIGAPDDAISLYLRQGYQPEQAASVDTSAPDHPNRKPESVPLIHRVSVVNAQGEPDGMFFVGSSVGFRVELDSRGAVYRGLNLNIQIFDPNENRLCLLTSRVQQGEFFTLDGRRTLTCYWDNCILGPGDYVVTVTLTWLESKPNGRPSAALDTLVRVVSFEMVAGDAFGTGQTIRHGRALLWPPVTWSLDDTPQPHSHPTSAQ